MHADHKSFRTEPQSRPQDDRDDALDSQIDAFEDEDIELALKSVCWTARDVRQFLVHRATR